MCPVLRFDISQYNKVTLIVLGPSDKKDRIIGISDKFFTCLIVMKYKTSEIEEIDSAFTEGLKFLSPAQNPMSSSFNSICVSLTISENGFKKPDNY